MTTLKAMILHTLRRRRWRAYRQVWLTATLEQVETLQRQVGVWKSLLPLYVQWLVQHVEPEEFLDELLCTTAEDIITFLEGNDNV